MTGKCAVAIVAVLMAVFGNPLQSARAETECESLDKKPVKVEAWISKKFRNEEKTVKAELESLGNTNVVLKVFPMNDPDKVLAIGRCVPVEIARLAIQVSLKYTGGIASLVDQNMFSPNWIGIGTMAFDKFSQQKIDAEQLKQLTDGSLSHQEFQELYRKLATPSDRARAWGVDVPNPKNLRK